MSIFCLQSEYKCKLKRHVSPTLKNVTRRFETLYGFYSFVMIYAQLIGQLQYIYNDLSRCTPTTAQNQPLAI